MRLILYLFSLCLAVSAYGQKSTAVEETQAKLKRVVVQEFNFRDAGVEDVLAFLVEISRNQALVDILPIPPRAYFNEVQEILSKPPEPDAREPAPEKPRQTDADFFFGGTSPKPLQKLRQTDADLFFGSPEPTAQNMALQKLRRAYFPTIDLEGTNLTLGATLELVRSKTEFEQSIHPSGFVLWHEKGYKPNGIAIADSEAAREAQRVMEERTFTELNFKDASIYDAVAFMQDVRGGRLLSAEERKRIQGPPVLIGDYPQIGAGIITLSLTRRNYLDAYWALAELAGGNCTIQSNGMVFISSKPRDYWKPLRLKDPQDQFKDVIIPETNFRNASMEVTLAFLNASVRALHPGAWDVRAVGIGPHPNVSLTMLSCKLSDILQLLQVDNDSLAFEVVKGVPD